MFSWATHVVSWCECGEVNRLFDYGFVSIQRNSRPVCGEEKGWGEGREREKKENGGKGKERRGKGETSKRRGRGGVEEKKGRGEREESEEWRMVMKCELHYYGMQYLPINHNVLNT